jgi:archaellin
MDTFFILVAFVFVFAVLAVVAYALFEVSPFAQHKESFRDPRTGKRRWQSPRLD